MTYSEVIRTLSDLANDYRNYSNAARNPSFSYSERVYYLGNAIHILQQIASVAHEYPAIVSRLPAGFLPDYSNNGIYRMYDIQRQIYLERLRELRRSISSGTYSLNDEMGLKLSRLRDTNDVLRNSSIEPPGARDARNHALGSVIGTALKYPIHLVSRVLQSGARLIGQVVAAPLHLITYPMSMIINPDNPYTGRMVQEIGNGLGDLLSTGVRIIDDGIMRL